MRTYRASANGCGAGAGRVATIGRAPRDDRSAAQDDGYAARDNYYAARDYGYAAREDGYENNSPSDDGYGS